MLKITNLEPLALEGVHTRAYTQVIYKTYLFTIKNEKIKY